MLRLANSALFFRSIKTITRLLRLPHRNMNSSSSASDAAPDPSVDGKEALQLYSWPTPNGLKISIFLEEAGIPYDYHPINISKNVQNGMRDT